MKNLQDNIEIDLNEENDFFNTLEKAKVIKGFIESYIPVMKQNKIMALFGEWGSGKSSVLKYIEKELYKQKVVTLYFNSWEYEKDKSLELSLFDALYYEAEKKGTKLIGLREQAFRVLGAIAKGFSLNTPIGNFNIKDMIEHAEKTEKTSFYNDVNSFKKSFGELENAILGEETDKKLVVFLDDLDRCEPENILNLLSAIKLFFTYGNGRIIFVCGIDKEAVHKALQIKYTDVIKATEYLEKIFDFSFNMPNSFDVEKALKISLKEYSEDIENYEDIIKNISNMFKAIGFTNPRHIKKIINKYIFFRIIYKNEDLKSRYSILENLSIKKENTFFLLVFFYLITLYEFYREEYDSIEFNDMKKENLKIRNLEGLREKARLEGKNGIGNMGAILKDFDGAFRIIENHNWVIMKSDINITMTDYEKIILILSFLSISPVSFIFSESGLLNNLKNISDKREYKFIKYAIDKYNESENFRFSMIDLREAISNLS